MSNRKLSAERRKHLLALEDLVGADLAHALHDLEAADMEIVTLKERLKGDVEFLQKILHETEMQNADLLLQLEELNAENKQLDLEREADLREYYFNGKPWRGKQ